MKKRAIVWLFASAAVLAAATGCGRGGMDDNSDGNSTDAKEEGTEQTPVDEVGTEYMADTENDTSQLGLGNAVEIPEGFEGELAESQAHGQLERVIADYCGISEDDYENVRYYYNYVDLNGDNKNEILALALGRDVDGINGNILLWMEDEGDALTTDSVRQSFRQVGAPVYISTQVTEGYRDLVIINNGGVAQTAADAGNTADAVDDSDREEWDEANDVGGAAAGAGARSVDSVPAADGTQTKTVLPAGAADENGIVPISMGHDYWLLTWTGEKYQDIGEGTLLDTMAGMEGTAILTNNIESDLVNDNYHFLGEAMK